MLAFISGKGFLSAVIMLHSLHSGPGREYDRPRLPLRQFTLPCPDRVRRRRQPKELPDETVYRKRERAGGTDNLQASGRHLYLLDQAFRVFEPLSCPHVALPIPAGAFGTGNKVDFFRACLKCLQQMEHLYPAAAGQREKADSPAQLLFEEPPVRVLIGIELLTEKDCGVGALLVGLHDIPTHEKRTSGEDVLVFLTPLCAVISLHQIRALVNSFGRSSFMQPTRATSLILGRRSARAVFPGPTDGLRFRHLMYDAIGARRSHQFLRLFLEPPSPRCSPSSSIRPASKAAPSSSDHALTISAVTSIWNWRP